jgi:2-polyprenyl-3-methyl-5-hydroxy-6-metoxy-1,4-benzoquinol methylase
MLDAFLDEGYSLLDVGCGTAGYHRILCRQGKVIGLDYSNEMIDSANVLAKRFGVRNTEYVACTFEDYKAAQQFDGIAFAGIYGWYRSWRGSQNVMNRLASMLAPGGLVVLSYVHPKGPFNWLKALLLGSRTMCIPEKEFLGMLSMAGLTAVLTLSKPHTRICFARKN